MNNILKRSCILNPLKDYSYFADECERLYQSVSDSEIKGRGYSGLSVADRWERFARTKGEKELVCLISGECANALISENGEAVWTGVALTAKAFGIESAWICCDGGVSVPDEYFSVAFKPVFFEHSVSSGEETLLFSKIEGSLPITRPKPPYPIDKGLFGKPTLIHSAELFAHFPYILENLDRNTKLCCVFGDVGRPGIYEVDLGESVLDIVNAAEKQEVKAVQVGGINGTILPENGLSIAYDYDSFRNKGLYFGDGSLRVMNHAHCIAHEIYKSLYETYRCSCGRCVFCREGLYQLYLLMEDLINGKATDSDLNLIKDLASIIKENAGCEFGKMTAAMICDAMEDFYDEIEAHTRNKCKALACPGMFTVHILPDKCSGCGECEKRCRSNAISGGEKLIHVIDQNKCTKCMECAPCTENALVRAGTQKPACPDRPIPVGTFVQKKKGLQKRT